MVNGPLSSSWHPALMPNAVPRSPSPAGADATNEAPAKPSELVPSWLLDARHVFEPEPNRDKEPEKEPEKKPEEKPEKETEKEHDGPAWFSEQDDADDGDAWLVGNDADLHPDTTSNVEAAQQSANEPPSLETEWKQAGDDLELLGHGDDTDARTTQASTLEEFRPQTMNSQHSSSMSFARTVSHEVNFNDDDDHEWNLMQSDADAPSSVLSPDKTAAFPAAFAQVPEFLEHSHRPLPPTQALDVMEKTEREWDINARNYIPGGASGVEPAASPDEADSWAEHRGAPPEAQDFEARYEEGIPLMSGEGVMPNTTQENEAANLVHSFADGNDDDENFFTQIQEPGFQANTAAPNISPIQRKSTMQAMGELRSSESSVSELEAEQATEREDQHDVPDVSNVPGWGDGRDQPNPCSEDLATKWQAAFAGGDEDEFLVEDPAAENDAVDVSAFLGSDDEGLLEDDAEVAPEPRPALAISTRQPSASSRYTPTDIPSRQPSSSYIPPTNGPVPTHPSQLPGPAPSGFPQLQAQHPPSRPEPSKAQSFADKSKGGYASPYDLPTDLLSSMVKPRKRTSLQQLPREQPPPPPRSTSMYSPGHPPSSGAPSSPAVATLANQAFSPSSLRHQSSFFEELPMPVKSRPSSRQSNASQQPNPYTPAGHPHSAPATAGPLIPPSSTAPQLSGVGGLIAPESASPYAALQSPAIPMPPPSANVSRYSPAPPGHGSSQGALPPSSTSRYSPAPSASRPGSSYGTGGGPIAPSQTSQPHLPRTSSPLAHFEASSDRIHRAGSLPNGDAHYADRRPNSFEPRLNRVSSLPPTREVDEEEDDKTLPSNRSFSAAQPVRPANMEPKHNSAPYLLSTRQTPPPRTYVPATALSPPKASSNYMPQMAPTAQPGFMPPPRPSTQSPAERRHGPHSDSSARPSSAHAVAAPNLTALQNTRRRGQSLLMNMVPPTDGRERDPLERWRGAPLLTWGVGGTVVTSFPKSVPRYTMNQTAPTILRTCGEVKVQNIRDIHPLADRLTKFPGPLKGKSKKKEALAWLAGGIDAQEKELPDIEFRPELSLEAKRGVERLLLWKLLRIFVESDGTLEGNPAVEKSVRDVLFPGASASPADGASSFPLASVGEDQAGAVTSMAADGADPAAMEQIRLDLLNGNRERAVWCAVDKRLWGHAMLISQTVSPDLYKRVAQEFVRKEVNFPGHNNESIAALYKVLSGNFDDCVDELVPIHARVGLQLVSKEPASEPARDAIDGLDKWRETLTLILSNRSPDDARGLNALGKLLSSYGRAEAAQICFIFSRSLSVFGGLDDQNADFVLLGSDHRRQSDQFAKETEALQLSEVYEYGLSLAGGSGAAAGAPHLAAYKLQYAVTLAEYGYRDKALQYCDAIAAAMVSQTRRSPYHHAILESAVDDFMTRLKQAPRDASSSWISKPSMNKVSDSMWNRFNKFVAGDDGENGANGGSGEADSGPFARVASTPNLSRSPSVSNFETFGGGSPSYAVNPALGPTSAASSRYAPAAAQPASMGDPHAPPIPPAPSSSGRTSNEYSRNAYEPAYPGVISPPAPTGSGYAPARHFASGLGFESFPQDAARLVSGGNENSAARLVPVSGGQHPHVLQESPNIYSQSGQPESHAYTADQGYQPPSFGYEPPQMTPVSDNQDKNEEGAAGGYEPPSYQPYGYEPPSYQPEPGPSAEEGDEPPKPKKNFMDDDEDDMSAVGTSGKSKAEKDRENEEMFRKAAEEDAKRAAAQQSGKKGWGFSGWFGGGKKNEANMGDPAAGKPIRAKLGEASSFVYDPELKRWVNRKPGAENVEAKKATPPPPRAAPRPAANGMPPAAAFPSPPTPSDGPGAASANGPPRTAPGLAPQPSQESLNLAPPQMSRSGSQLGAAGGPPSRPPSRPTTSMSNASSIDDLLGAAAPRKGGQRKPRKSGRYVDVMAK